MARYQQRRARFAAIAAAIVVVLYLAFFRSQDASVTWHLPIPTPTQTPTSVKEQAPIDALSSSTSISSVPTTSRALPKLPTSSPAAERPNLIAESPKKPEIPTPSPTTEKPASSIESPNKPKIPDHLSETEKPEIPDGSSINVSSSATPEPTKSCVSYMALQRMKQEPLSEGSRKFPYQRPSPECRTFNLPAMESLIERMKGVIKDPDLFRLFENSYPNTLDTMIKWRGYAKEEEAEDQTPLENASTAEELTYVITGDIDAMWLRDSASQIYSYLPLLEASSDPDSLASLWRGVINAHARYIIISPYCHSFQPPPESGVPTTLNGAYSQNHPNPPYDPKKVFDCKWELDSLASFLQISTAYYKKTDDLAFFQKFSWIPAVRAAVDAAGAMRLGTYSPEGKVEHSAWTFTGWTNRGSETLTNDGLGNPTKANGMVRTAFRPSDDACIYQLFVPANMMWAKYLEEGSLIMEKLEGEEAKNLTSDMREQAFGIRKGIDRDAIVHHRDFGDIFAFEIDGFGGTNLMDDSNVPSLLAMPLWNYAESSFELPPPPEGEKPKDYAAIYANTRKFVLSDSNPYFSKGPAISAVGGPHTGPGKAWPMAAIIRAMTAFSLSIGEEDIEEEVKGQIMTVLNSTAGTGVIHESVNSWNERDWSRPWFGWANGLFGELVLKVAEEDKRAGRKPGWLGGSWQ